jgi:hypothetical protein
LKIIAGDQYCGLRHRFARYVVLENTARLKRFSIYDAGTKRAAQAMLTEFSADEDLAKKLETILAEANQRARESNQAKAEQREKEQNILSQMV